MLRHNAMLYFKESPPEGCLPTSGVWVGSILIGEGLQGVDEGSDLGPQK